MPLTSAAFIDGWVCIPYTGADQALVEITTGDQTAPAYLDWVDRPDIDEAPTRVAKVRPASLGLTGAEPVTLALLVDHAQTWQGRLA